MRSIFSTIPNSKIWTSMPRTLVQPSLPARLIKPSAHTTHAFCKSRLTCGSNTSEVVLEKRHRSAEPLLFSRRLASASVRAPAATAGSRSRGVRRRRGRSCGPARGATSNGGRLAAAAIAATAARSVRCRWWRYVARGRCRGASRRGRNRNTRGRASWRIISGCFDDVIVSKAAGCILS
jgi:hypothetical protein